MFEFYRRYEELCAQLRDHARSELGWLRLERERSDWQELAYASRRTSDTKRRLRQMPI